MKKFFLTFAILLTIVFNSSASDLATWLNDVSYVSGHGVTGVVSNGLAVGVMAVPFTIAFLVLIGTFVKYKVTKMRLAK